LTDVKANLYDRELEDWNINAEFYLRETESPFFQIIHKEKIDTYNLQNEGNMLLDLGAGIGYFANNLREKGKKVIAIDFSYEMLRIAKKEYPNIVYVVASADNLPFKDNVFDIITANGVLHHLKAQNLLENSINEINKALKENGVFCLFDRNGSFLSLVLHGFIMFIKKIMVKIKGKFSGSSSMSEPSFTDRDLKIVQNSGFKIVNRKFVASIPSFVMIVLANSIEYFISLSLSNSFRKKFLSLFSFFEYNIRSKQFCVEQCVKFRKVR
jgi:demethylmenaquinone methyltransferase/2-methoxy-6-polyprenyl-1,4-benzoquinol methylase